MSSEQTPPQPIQDQDAVAAAAASPAPAPSSGDASAQDLSTQTLLHHLYKAKALSERLLTVMSEREERLAEIKRRVSALEQGGESVQPLVEAEANMKDAHNRMKAVLGDLGKELDLAGVTTLPTEATYLADLPAHTGQSDEVAFLYKHLLLALGEWKAAQKRLVAERAESLSKQVQNLREQVAREHAETQRIRRRKEELERLRVEKQEELEAIRREEPNPDAGANGNQQQ
jgi:chromosome segregation ATPase